MPVAGITIVRRRDTVALAMAAMLTLAADGAAQKVPEMSAASAVAPSMPRRLFVSGHSLTARPFPDHLAALGAAAGRPVEWRMQHQYGSTLGQRIAGAMADGASYDAVIVTERSTLLESLIWDDTVTHLSTLAKRARARNRHVATYLFASWVDIDPTADPERWIAFQRLSGAAWRCTARAAGDDIAVIPAGEALALLLERIVAGQVPDLSGATLRAVFTDEVHLTPAATYYTALIAHGVLNGSLPDPVAVEGVSLPEATALNAVARDFLVAPVATPVDKAACRKFMADQYVPAYLRYIRDVRWRRDDGWARAQYKWARFALTWPGRFRGSHGSDPLG